MNSNTATSEAAVQRPATNVLRTTPSVILGPFYPVATAADTVTGSQPWNAPSERQDESVQSVDLGGRVVNVAGDPVAGALVEIWQADEHGRYRHPSAPLPVPERSGFIGYGAVRTDDHGRYRFFTLRPGPYGNAPRRRAPHIHFQVTWPPRPACHPDVPSGRRLERG